MTHTPFAELFGGYITIKDAPLNCSMVTDCLIDQSARSMTVTLECSSYVKKALLDEAAHGLREQLMLRSVNFLPHYPGDKFCPAACADISDFLKGETCQLNGFLEGAEYALQGDVLTVTLKNGGLETLKNLDFEKRFSAMVKTCFSRDLSLRFDGVTERKEIVEEYIHIEPQNTSAIPNDSAKGSSTPKNPAVKSKKAPQIRPTDSVARSLAPMKTHEPGEKTPDGLPVYLDTARLFYGARLSTKVRPLIDILPPEDDYAELDFVGWGEVFGLESREINTKRGPRVTVKFSFSDYTNSINAKMFLSPDQFESLTPLKNGAFVVVNGIYKYDNYLKEFIVDVKSLADVQRYEEMDSCTVGRRVELHCHTNMSSKDAVSSAGSIVK